MIIYTWIVFVLNIFAIGISVREKDNNAFVKTILSTCLYLPLFGRILGWW